VITPGAPHEAVVTLDGRPRPAVVLARAGDQVLVRYRHAGAHEERWVPEAAVVTVETGTARPPLAKLAGLGLVGLLGLALLLWPGGSDKPLLSPTPTPTTTSAPTATPTPSTTPTPAVVRAVLFGDSLTAGKGNPAGTRTTLEVAAAALHWQYVVHAALGTGWTTHPSYGERLVKEVTTAPSVLVLQGGASDTSASAAQLGAAVRTTVAALRARFPHTRLVLVGPVAMEQPPDQSLVRVSATLKATASALHLTYVDPIPWITAATWEKYVAPTSFYPNPSGHAYLGARLATVLRTLNVTP
jgi:hypothetical protein